MRHPTFIVVMGLFCLFLITTPNINNLTLLGTIDSVSLASLALALILLPFIFGKTRIALFTSTAITTAFLLYNVSANIYFYFLQSYPLLDYVPILLETANQINITNLAFLLTAVIFIALTSYFILAQLPQQKVALQTKTLIISSLFLTVFAYGQYHYKERYTFATITTLKDTNATGFLLRSTINAGWLYQDQESIQQHKLSAILSALQNSSELPEEYHFASLSKLAGTSSTDEYAIPLPNKFPLYKVPRHKTSINNDNVIVIVLESFRASEMGVYGAKISASPNLDRLSKHFSVFKNSYSTASFTVKSEFALTCGTLDYYTGPPISSRGDVVNKRCIPNMLSDLGYETTWYHGNDKEFYNREQFLNQIGFKEIKDETYFKESGLADELGWGLPDIQLFDYSLKDLTNKKQPFYAEILTVSNHTPFDHNWGIDIPEEISYSENDFFNAYRKGIYYSDHAIGDFIENFLSSPLAENTHLIITGDHGVWTFDNEEEMSQLTKDEQFFRVPLMIYSPNTKSEHISANVSHLDIAPTILNLLQASSANSFLGLSLKEPSEVLNNRTIYNFYDRVYSYRNGTEVCVSLNGCIASSECPTHASTIKGEKDILNMMCADKKSVQNMLNSVAPTHFTNSNSTERSLMDYSQLTLVHESEPKSIKLTEHQL